MACNMVDTQEVGIMYIYSSMQNPNSITWDKAYAPSSQPPDDKSPFPHKP